MTLAAMRVRLPWRGLHNACDWSQNFNSEAGWCRWVAMCGYIGFAVLAAGCIPLLYPPLKWYMVLVAFAVAPVFSVANAYGCGVTDWDQVRLRSARPAASLWVASGRPCSCCARWRPHGALCLCCGAILR